MLIEFPAERRAEEMGRAAMAHVVDDASYGDNAEEVAAHLLRVLEGLDGADARRGAARALALRLTAWGGPEAE